MASRIDIQKGGWIGVLFWLRQWRRQAQVLWLAQSRRLPVEARKKMTDDT
jgi:hypothetical protein